MVIVIFNESILIYPVLDDIFDKEVPNQKRTVDKFASLLPKARSGKIIKAWKAYEADDKDSFIDEYQIVEARAMGADCILLIVSVFLDFPQFTGGNGAKNNAVSQMLKLESLAHSFGMAVLVEVHNDKELALALQLNTPLIGINNRNLHTFETKLDTTLNLLSQFPQNTTETSTKHIVITESGILVPSDVTMMRDHNIHAFLVGEALMRSDDPGIGLARLFG